eukprot:6191073-Pleurochrysis_carterae.AAC.1
MRASFLAVFVRHAAITFKTPFRKLLVAPLYPGTIHKCSKQQGDARRRDARATRSGERQVALELPDERFSSRRDPSLVRRPLR